MEGQSPTVQGIPISKMEHNRELSLSNQNLKTLTENHAKFINSTMKKGATGNLKQSLNKGSTTKLFENILRPHRTKKTAMKTEADQDESKPRWK